MHGSSLPAGQELAPTEVQRLFDACDLGENLGARTYATLALLFGGGLRRAEAVSVTMHGIDARRRGVTITGKRKKQRFVPLGAWFARLEPWLTRRGSSPGPLLCALGRWNKIRHGHGITTVQLYNSLQAIGDATGVAFSPHDARRTRGTGLLRSGVDIRTVQRLLGHESIQTTAGYDRRAEREMIEAIENVPLAPQPGS